MTQTVLFHYPALNVGGAEKSSLRMIKALCDRGWEVTLVLTTGGGSLEPEIDPRARVVRLRPRACGHAFLSARGVRQKLRALPDLVCYVAMRAIGMARMIPFLFRRYDAGVLLSISTSPSFIHHIVKCRVRVHWIRNDFEGNFPARRRSIYAIRKYRANFDHYICVSRVVRNSLIKAIPEIASKTTVVYNILDAESMRASAKDAPGPFPKLPAGTIKILTVCRLKDRSKGLFRIVRVGRRLYDDGFDFVWFVAGDGPDRNAFYDAIRNAGMTERMVLLGHLSNPFPAYRDADLVAVLSYYEGLCGVVNEAKVMGCAVLATQMSGIDEQLTDNQNGFIAANDEEGIYRRLREILSTPALLKKIKNTDYSPQILDDHLKLDRIERLFLNKETE